MITLRNRMYQLTSFTLDLSLTVLAFFLAYFIRILPSVQNFFQPTLKGLDYHWWFVLVIVPIWALVFMSLGVYRRRASTTLKEQLTLICCGVLLGGAVLMTLLLLGLGREFSRSLILFFLVVDFFLLGLKTFIGSHLGRRSRPYRMLVVGTLEKAREFCRLMEEREYQGIELVGVLCIDDSPGGTQEESIPMIGGLSQLCEVLDNEEIESVVFSVPAERMSALEEALHSCEEIGVRIYLDLAIDGLQFARGTTGSIGGKPLLAFLPRSAAKR